jgi:8-oxo-dGTP pyrophosphatase MutT (NUDIX family)
MRECPGAAPEVLLVRRHSRNLTAGDAYVFPGGLLEPRDCTAEALGLDPDFTPERAAAILGTAGSPERALGLFLAAIRETFEEVGILLARDEQGRPWRAHDHDAADVQAARAALHSRTLDFPRWLAERRLRPAFSELAYYAHWITPEAMARRFDTRFFLAEADAAARAEPDQAEIVECRWITPSDALAAHRERRMAMVNATLKNLELLSGFAGVCAARDDLCSRKISAILPKAVFHGKDYRIVNPWDAGYDTL